MSIEYDSSGDRLVLGTVTPTKLDNLQTLSNGYSLTFWFYRTGDTTTAFGTAYIHWTGNNAGNAQGWRIFIGDAAGASPGSFGWYDNVTTRRRDTANNTLTGNNIWHFVCVTVLPGTAAADIHWYTALAGANAVTEPSYSITNNGVGASGDDSGHNQWIGSVSAVGQDWSPVGRIAEYKIFNRALNINEVNGVFRNTKLLGMIFHAPLWPVRLLTALDPDPDLTPDKINPQIPSAGSALTRANHAPVGQYVHYVG